MSFPDAIALERTDDELPEGMGSSSIIRRLLLHGETLSADEAAELTGKTPGLLGAVMKMMEKWGFEFDRIDREDAQNGYKLRNPQHIPTERFEVESTEPKQRRRRRGELVHKNTMPADLMPPPQLDQELQVYLVFRDPADGSIKVGIRNGDQAWLARVEGHVEVNNLRM